MIRDELNVFALDTALDTNGTGDANVGDVIDTRSLGGLGSTLGQLRNLGVNPKPLYFVVIVTTTVLASGGASTVSFELVSDSTASISEDDSETSHIKSPFFAKATLVAGFRYIAQLPPGDYERYLGVQQDVTDNAVTAGKISAFLTDNPGIYKAYADGSN